MARIDYCDTSKSSERTREILGKNRNANIFRMMAHSPSYFEQYCRSAAQSATGASSSGGARTRHHAHGILCEAPYEVVAHKRIGKNAGVTDEQNEALENWKSATCFNEVQRAALAFTDEIVRLRRPTDATFNAIASELRQRRWSSYSFGRLLHHDFEVPGDFCDRHAAGDGSGVSGSRWCLERAWLGCAAFICARLSSSSSSIS